MRIVNRSLSPVLANNGELVVFTRHSVLQTGRSVGFFGWAYAMFELRE